MNKIDWRGVRDCALRTLRQKSPEILTGVGIGGMLTTTVLAVKATPEALRRIEAKKQAEHCEKLTLTQTVQAAWKCYILPGVTGTVSAACLILAIDISGRRNAALVSAATLYGTELKEYRSKVVEAIGEKKETAIQDAIDRDRVERDPPPKKLEAPTPNGLNQPVLCYDAMFGRYFYSDVETLKRVENKLNWQMNNMSEPYVSLNEFYSEIDSPYLTPVDVGDDLGWRSDRGLIDLRFSSQLVNGHTPCLVMTHKNPPEYGYSDA